MWDVSQGSERCRFRRLMHGERYCLEERILFRTRKRNALSGFGLGGVWVNSIAVATWLAAGGCTSTAMPPGSSGSSSPTGRQLATLITETDPYQQWSEFPDRQGTLPSVLPHGPMSRVFINAAVESALATDFTGQLPDGSIIVKENVGTSPEVTEAALTVMWKVQGFDPPNNDWFWANVTPDGQIAAEGKVQACAACHGGVRENDFVFVHPF